MTDCDLRIADNLSIMEDNSSLYEPGGEEDLFTDEEKEKVYA